MKQMKTYYELIIKFNSGGINNEIHYKSLTSIYKKNLLSYNENINLYRFEFDHLDEIFELISIYKYYNLTKQITNLEYSIEKYKPMGYYVWEKTDITNTLNL